MNKCICTTESLCCLSEINNIVNQLSSHKIKKKYLNDLKTFKFKNFWYVNILNLLYKIWHFPLHFFIHRQQLILLLFDHINDQILDSNTHDFYLIIGIVRLIMFVIFGPYMAKCMWHYVTKHIFIFIPYLDDIFLIYNFGYLIITLLFRFVFSLFLV